MRQKGDISGIIRQTRTQIREIWNQSREAYIQLCKDRNQAINNKNEMNASRYGAKPKLFLK